VYLLHRPAGACGRSCVLRLKTWPGRPARGPPRRPSAQCSHCALQRQQTAAGAARRALSPCARRRRRRWQPWRAGNARSRGGDVRMCRRGVRQRAAAHAPMHAPSRGPGKRKVACRRLNRFNPSWARWRLGAASEGARGTEGAGVSYLRSAAPRPRFAFPGAQRRVPAAGAHPRAEGRSTDKTDRVRIPASCR
jgi:hypothetical protein